MKYISDFLRINRQRASSASFVFLLYGLLLVPAYAEKSTSITAQEKIKISGVKFKETLTLGGSTLQFNGAGLRTKFFIDLYISALYLPEKSQDAATIIHADEVMLIQIHVISNLITSENLSKGTAEGFSKSTNNNTHAIQKQIDDFLDAFNAPVKVGDIFEIVYQPNIGITVLKNRKLAKRIASDMVFKQALFGIWLSDRPAQNSLKASMLGK